MEETVTDLAERAVRPNGELYSSDPSERMKQLHLDGRAGGEFGKLGGRPRKVRAAEKVAEAAKEHADEITQAFIDVLQDDEAPHKLKIETAMKWIEVERKEDELQLEEDKHEDLNRDQLMQKIIDMSEAATVAQKSAFVDADSVELPNG